jgi:hypothetical protein
MSKIPVFEQTFGTKYDKFVAYLKENIYMVKERWDLISFFSS